MFKTKAEEYKRRLLEDSIKYQDEIVILSKDVVNDLLNLVEEQEHLIYMLRIPDGVESNRSHSEEE